MAIQGIRAAGRPHASVGSRACSPTTTCTCAPTRTTRRRSATSPRRTSSATWRRPEAAGIEELGFSEHIYRFTAGARPLAPSLVGALGHRRPRRLLRVRRRLAAAAGDRVRLRPRRRGPHRGAARGARLRLRGRLGPLHRRPRRSTPRASTSGTRSGDPDEVWRRYFEALAECARCGLFDILAHPDLVKVWGGARPLPERDPRFYYEPAVEAIAESGIAVEVSTAGLRKPVGEIYPAPAFAEMCVEAGAAFALSSDAHLPEQVGFGYERALGLPRRARGGRDLRLRGARSGASSRSARPAWRRPDEPGRDRLRQPPLRRGPAAWSSAGSRSSTRAASPGTPTPTSSPTR